MNTSAFLFFNTRSISLFVLLVFSSLICVAIQGAKKVEYGENPKESKHEDTARDVINRINNKDNGNTIIFSPKMNSLVRAYGYDNLFNYYYDKFGDITSWYKSSEFPGVARFQIIAKNGRWSMNIIFSEDGSVASLSFTEPDPILPVPERNTTRMRLPFREEWCVEMGGSTQEQNYHVNAGRSVCRAVDFTMRDAEGSSCKGDGTNAKEMAQKTKIIIHMGRIFLLWLKVRLLR